VPATTTTTTVPVAVASGAETVLSPIGLNVRSGPSKKAAVIGSAIQGTVFQLLDRTSRDGGWYKVRGTTVTGWISSNPTFSAPGRFSSYSSTAFSVLYPAGWVATGSPAAGVKFHAPSPTAKDKVVITVASSVAKLPAVKQGAGVAEDTAQQVVACGVTVELYTYTTANPDRYLASATVPLGPHRALGLQATLTSLTQLRTVLHFVDSISFPVVVCVGRPPAPPKAAHK